MSNNSSKIIHYCWFGGNPLSDLTKKCIETWKKYLPDFEIKEWNEENFDINQCEFIKGAYAQKKWAFVSDYTRFKVLEEYGGLYLDTDMEITADIAKYLENEMFLGIEDSKLINAAVVWCKSPNNENIKEIIKHYESKKEFNETGDLYDESVPQVLTKYFSKYGYNPDAQEPQVLNNVHIYPMDYFYPLSYDYQHNKFSDNTCMIHHFDATWITPMEKFKTKMKRENKIWVVYLIDFCISIKNHIRKMINFKDVALFIFMFAILMFTAFSYTPLTIDVDSNYVFNVFKGNYNIVACQAFLFSFVLVYILRKVREIHVNRLFDKIAKIDPNNEEQLKKKMPKISDEKRLLVTNYENIIYIIQFTVTMLFVLIPTVALYVVIPNIQLLASVTMMGIIYLIYSGVKKRFKYRILELVPFGFLIAFIGVFLPRAYALFAIITFLMIALLSFRNKISKKRLLSFVISVILFTSLLVIFRLVMPECKIEVADGISFDTSLVNFDKINKFDSFSLNEYNTEFNIAKRFFGGILLSAKDGIVMMPTLSVYISVIMIIIIMILNKNYRYAVLIIPCILNCISLGNIAIDSLLYALTNNIFVFFVTNILLLSVIKSMFTKKV